ncbi:MAG: GNAT family N-acetyltransferase [Pseudomonadota bacterium]
MTTLYIEDGWLAAQIQKDAYRILPSSGLTLPVLAELPDDLSFCYAKVAAGDTPSVAGLVARGFRFINTQASLAKDTTEFVSFTSSNVRETRPEDRDYVWDIACRSFIYDRFHQDEILNPFADHLNASWAVNYYSGNRGTDMLVWEEDGVVAGFILLLVKDGVFSIDLIAVDGRFKRRGVAYQLVAAAEAKYSDSNRYTVVTQLENTPALQLYSRLGYEIGHIDCIFHRHG